MLLLNHLFNHGAKRIYIEVYEDNVVSLKAHLVAGYRELGRIEVRKTLSNKTYVRWL
jgi:RimJ/RimL family protein N-acetyltransferase